MKRIARRVLKGQKELNTSKLHPIEDGNVEFADNNNIHIFTENDERNGNVLNLTTGGYGPIQLPEVVVNGEMPRDALGLPLYDKNGNLTQYDDGGMKDNHDWAATHVMYPVMGAVAAAPYVVPWLASTVTAAAPYVSTGARFVGKLVTPSTYTNWIIPKIATRLGASASTTARLTSLIGAGADMASAGYFAYDAGKNIYNAWKHPENLKSWKDYGKLGLDALAVAGPLGEANRTLTALNKSVRIPTLLWTRHNNIPLRFANWAANMNGKYEGWKHNVNYLDQSSDVAKEIRQELYQRWNPLAGWLQRSRSWEARARQAALDEIQTDINIFNKYYNPEIQRKTGSLINLGKPTDYVNDFEFSYLPYAKSGYLWLNKYGGVTQHAPTGLKNIYINTNVKNKSFMKTLLDATHEGEHAFRLNLALTQRPGLPYFGRYSGRYLNSAYRTTGDWDMPIWSNYARPSEKAATNAELRYFLRIKPEEANAIPTERLIRMDSDGNISTIYEDMVRRNLHSGYMFLDEQPNYLVELRKQLREEAAKNIAQGGKGKMEVFPNFAEQWAANMRRALKFEYKHGGKI